MYFFGVASLLFYFIADFFVVVSPLLFCFNFVNYCLFFQYLNPATLPDLHVFSLKTC